VAGTDVGEPNVNLLGKSVYTTYLFPFEATAALLIIAVVGAVVLARRPPVATNPVDEVDAVDDPAIGDTSGGTPDAAPVTDVPAVPHPSDADAHEEARP